MFKKTNFLIIFLLFLLSGCSTVSHHHRYRLSSDSAPNFKIDVSRIPNATPKREPLNKHANPASYKVLGHRYRVLKSAKGYDETGIASWYGMKFHRHRTSSGEYYDVAAMTAASKTLPIPTYVNVINLQNKKTVIVKINDRGPFHENRIIDLSYAAAAKLGVFPAGTALVEVKAIDVDNPDDETNNTANIAHATPSACMTKQPTHAPQIYLQIGAFRIEKNAKNLLAKIQCHTKLTVFIRPVNKNGLDLYRVQIGPIANVDNTDSLYFTLKKAGLGQPVTVIQ